MTAIDVHRKSMDELPLSEWGWQWLAETGRSARADKVIRPDFQTNGGVVSAWRGKELICYFVIARDSYNWSDLHCQDMGVSVRNQLEVSEHRLAEDARSAGERWMTTLGAAERFACVETNESLTGAVIVTAWSSLRHLWAYFAVLPSPGDDFVLVCKRLPESQVKSDTGF